MNSFGINLTGRMVLLDREIWRDRRELRFVCTAGAGCIPHAPGDVIVGHFVDSPLRSEWISARLVTQVVQPQIAQIAQIQGATQSAKSAQSAVLFPSASRQRVV